jgi:hypothetical protein
MHRPRQTKEKKDFMYLNGMEWGMNIDMNSNISFPKLNHVYDESSCQGYSQIALCHR